RMVDIGRDDGAAARDLVAHELRRADIGNGGTEALAVGGLAQILAAEILADRDVFHLRRDDAGAGISELRDRLAALGAQRLAPSAIEERHRALLFRVEAVILGLHL